MLTDWTMAALACLSPARRLAPEMSRHAVWERLAKPDRRIDVAIPWLDDDGSVRLSRGRLAAYTASGPGRGRIVFREKDDQDAVDAQAFLGRLQSALLDRDESFALFAVGADPGELSDGESMRLCAGAAEALRRCAPELLPVLQADDVPTRERGYLGGRLSSPPSRSGAYSPAEGAGYGLACFARELMRRADVRMDGTAAAVLGDGWTADAVREALARMGAVPASPGGRADVLVLCDADTPVDEARAAALADRRPVCVLEGVPLAAAPEAAARFRRENILFAPAIAACAGGAILRPLGALSRWEAERQLRGAMARVFGRVWDACPGDPCRGAYIAALERAAEAMIRTGV